MWFGRKSWFPLGIRRILQLKTFCPLDLMQETRGGEGRQKWSQWIVLQHSQHLECLPMSVLGTSGIQPGRKTLALTGRAEEMGWVWIALKEMMFSKLFLGILARVKSVTHKPIARSGVCRCKPDVNSTAGP